MADEEQSEAIKAMKAKAEAKKEEHKDSPEMEGFGAAQETEQKKQDDSGTSFHLKIYSPYKVYFEGNVESVTAENLTGTFDILKGHKNFLTLLTPYELNIRSVERGDEKLKINRGVMRVKQDEVIIFLDV